MDDNLEDLDDIDSDFELDEDEELEQLVSNFIYCWNMNHCTFLTERLIISFLTFFRNY